MTNGLDDFATNVELREALREPIPPHLITKVDKGFGKIDTVNHAVVTDRLNKAAPGWTTSEPQVVTVQGADGQPHVMAVICSMTIGTVTRWECGEVEHPSTYGDELKKAMSDFVKRAAMRFGVALDLWSKEDLHAAANPPGPVAAGAPAEASGPRPGEVAPTDGEAAASAGAPAAADPSTTATEEQWQRLVAVVGGSDARALTRLNKVNRTSYTKATVAFATAAEVAAAITGEAVPA